MTKHSQVKCHLCGQLEFSSHLLKSGCRKCRQSDWAEKVDKKADSESNEQAKARALMAQVEKREAFMDSVQVALDAAVAGIQTCACCLTHPHNELKPFVEIDDGRHFCERCAFGVLRSGYCPIHKTTHIVLEAVPRTRIAEYPADVLAPFTKEMFDGSEENV